MLLAADTPEDVALLLAELLLAWQGGTPPQPRQPADTSGTLLDFSELAHAGRDVFVRERLARVFRAADKAASLHYPAPADATTPAQVWWWVRWEKRSISELADPPTARLRLLAYEAAILLGFARAFLPTPYPPTCSNTRTTPQGGYPPPPAGDLPSPAPPAEPPPAPTHKFT